MDAQKLGTAIQLGTSVGNGVFSTVDQYGQTRDKNYLQNLAKTAVTGESSQDPTIRFISDIAGVNTKEAIKTIKEDSYTPINANNNQDLMSQYQSLGLLNTLNTRAGGNRTVGQNLTDNLSASFKGASAGSSFGPWGALIGGVAGGLLNLTSKFTEPARAKKMNTAIEKANIKKLDTFNTQANTIADKNYYNYLANYMANGGFLSGYGSDFTNGVTEFNVGGTHNKNINGGIPQGLNAEGVPNLVEEGEVKWNNYIFSNRNKVTKNSIEPQWKNFIGKTYAEGAKMLSKESKERPNDIISKNGLNANLAGLATIQESNRKPSKINNKFDVGGPLLPNTINTTDYINYIKNIAPSWYNTKTMPTYDNYIKQTSNIKNNKNINQNKNSNFNLSSYMRQAPIAGSLLGLGLNLKPLDYSGIENMKNSFTAISPNLESTYMSYTPTDTSLPLTYLNNQSAANRKAISNISGGNRATLANNLLALNYATTRSIGELNKQVQESNLAQKQRVLEFNRGTNQFNRQQQLQSAMFNTEGKYRAAQNAFELQQRLRSEKEAAISQNLSGLFENIGNVGKEKEMLNMISSNPYLLYMYDKNKNIIQK